MGGCVIRPYAPADLDTVIDIFQRAIREIASADYGPYQIAAWSRVDRAAWAAERAGRSTWVAWRSGEAAGFIDLEPDGHLDRLFVHPAHGRRGVARRLIATAQAHALSLGLDGLRTEASLTARPVFEAAGFRVLAEETVTRNGVAFRRFRMRKEGLKPKCIDPDPWSESTRPADDRRRAVARADDDELDSSPSGIRPRPGPGR